MKVKIIFNLPEDSDEFDLATSGSGYHNALCDLDQYLRNDIKYGNYSEQELETRQIIRDRLHEAMNDNNVNFIL